MKKKQIISILKNSEDKKKILKEILEQERLDFIKLFEDRKINTPEALISLNDEFIKKWGGLIQEYPEFKEFVSEIDLRMGEFYKECANKIVNRFIKTEASEVLKKDLPLVDIFGEDIQEYVDKNIKDE